MDQTLLNINFNAYAMIYRNELNKLIAQIASVSPYEIAPATVKSYASLISKDRDHTMTNQEVFDDTFYRLTDIPLFDPKVRDAISYFEREIVPTYNNRLVNAYAKEGAFSCVAEARRLGLKVVLATNPTFSPEAIECRMGWGNLDILNFDHVTHGQNSYDLKPNSRYYADTARAIGVTPQECLMVGNDPRRDIVQPNIGMQTAIVSKRFAPRAIWQGDLISLSKNLSSIVTEINGGLE